MSSSSSAPIRIATRGSHLALAQAHTVLDRCRRAFPRLTFELRVMKTTGDRRQKVSMAVPGKLPKGLFTKELEAALLAGEAELAVHSLKDLPTELPAGLRLAAVLERADPRDVLLLRRADLARSKKRTTNPSPLDRLRPGAIVATSSTRRAAQLRACRPDLQLVEIRGNVPTRLLKLAQNPDFDATILAAAGLARLGIVADAHGVLRRPADWPAAEWDGAIIPLPLDFDVMLPAPGQAAIGLECRADDRRTAAICRRLNHADTLACVQVERAFLAGFGGGCHSPLAALAVPTGRRLHVRAVVFGDQGVWHEETVLARTGSKATARRLGRSARRALALPAAA